MFEEQTTLPTEQQDAPIDRREALSEAFDQIEDKQDRARDDAGRFAKNEQKPQVEEASKPQEVQAAPAEVYQPSKLTTWKKDFIPLHEKLEQGLPLTADEAKQLAAYNLQRESEYSTGISMHKDRATRLEHFEKAMEPFMPVLQQNNMTPDVWIGNLGRAHHALVTGNDQQRLEMFMHLAQQYKVPLTGLGRGQGGQADPNYLGLLEQINQLSGRLQAVDGWREQQEQERVTQAISEFADAEKYPHFEAVRGTMAQLLEKGLAPDLQTAYAKAVRFDDEVWTAEQARQSQAAQAAQANQQANVVAKAKAKAVSPRSSTPSGAITTGKPSATDRRALLSASFDEAIGRV